MRVEIIPLLKDNYAYILEDRGAVVVIDPSEAGPIEEALEDRPLAAIWCTHHHLDHTGGIAELAAQRPGLQVVGSQYDLDQARIASQTLGVAEGDSLRVGDASFKVMAVPGHTLGAIAYFGQGALFTGDTLFLAGCGRMFEGTPKQMFASLQALAALPTTTHIYCGHEYTQNNLRFAASVEPNNEAIAKRAGSLRALSVPATLAEELQTNPFLRARDAAHFAELRMAKDSF